jgi:hypothetical protein
MATVPDVVTHNYDPKRGPFRNICKLSHAEAVALLAEIAASSGRSIKADYLSRRLETEDWLRSERNRKLGATRLERPIYFFLGDFADGRDPSRPESFVVPLAAFPPEVLTFTYPDSMASLAIARRDSHIPHRRAYHGQVFTLREIKDVVATYEMPGERWKTEAAMQYDRFIEMQLWDERPLAFLVKQLGGLRPGTARAGCALRGDARGRTSASG